jgi:hypothetical protein
MPAVAHNPTAPPPSWEAERARLEAQIAALTHQLEWFKRQLFGEKSERRHLQVPPEQMSLGEGLGAPQPQVPPTQPVAACLAGALPPAQAQPMARSPCSSTSACR